MSDEKNISFTKNDFDLVNRELLHTGFLNLARYQVRYRLFKGGWSDTISREVMERQSAAAILPYDPVLDRVVLIEQFRPGAISSPNGPWLLEVVAGILTSPDEKPDDLVKREAFEEAGCDILDLHPICQYFVSPGGSNEYLWLFIGRVDASQPGGIYGLKEEHEDIRSVTVSLDEAARLLQQDLIQTAPLIIGLQWLLLNREWLKQLWLKK